MANVQQKIEEESKKNAKKAKQLKKDEEEGKIVKENENSNYNKKKWSSLEEIYTSSVYY